MIWVGICWISSHEIKCFPCTSFIIESKSFSNGERNMWNSLEREFPFVNEIFLRWTTKEFSAELIRQSQRTWTVIQNPFAVIYLAWEKAINAQAHIVQCQMSTIVRTNRNILADSPQRTLDICCTQRNAMNCAHRKFITKRTAPGVSKYRTPTFIRCFLVLVILLYWLCLLSRCSPFSIACALFAN